MELNQCTLELKSNPAQELHKEQMARLQDQLSSYEKCNQKHANIQQGYLNEIKRLKQKMDCAKEDSSGINDSPLRKMKTYSIGLGGSPNPKKVKV